jgi:hypothetical protein
MQEVKIKNNPLQLKCFVEGYPKMSNISRSQAEMFAEALEKRVYESFLKKQKQAKPKND